MSEMKDWTNKNGITTPNKVDLCLDSIVQLTPREIRSMPLEDLEDFMCNLSAYNIYLKSLKGTISAQITQHETQFKRKLYLKTKKASGNFREEKESTALEINRDLKKLEADLTLLRMQLAKINDIPFTIDRHLNIVKMIYNRRVAVDKGQY